MDITKEYEKLISSIEFTEVDESLIQKHIDSLGAYANDNHLALTIHDLRNRATIYKSNLYLKFFNEDSNIIHPDDLEELIKGGIVAYKYFLTNKNINVNNFKLIRSYRLMLNGEYKVIYETITILEFDNNNNVWLTYDCVEIAPLQQQFQKPSYKLFNIATGDVVSIVTDYISDAPILSKRELDVLRLIEKGFISKEIAEKLSISVHTVNTHRQRILEKLKVDTSIEAVRYAYNLGVL